MPGRTRSATSANRVIGYAAKPAALRSGKCASTQRRVAGCRAAWIVSASVLCVSNGKDTTTGHWKWRA